MAHLTDMEELLASVESPDVRDYMREAMNCYMGSAYRGCIVLSYIALFDDLLAKLAELGKVNKEAKLIYDEANKKKNDQEVFESYLIDQLAAKSLLSGLDTAFLNTIRTLRNKSAHPSGHRPSAEEARFIFFEVINRVLSKPILSTTQLVDELISRLKNKNFFPSRHISEVKEVVEEELAVLHEAAVPRLVSKLSVNTTSADSNISRNAGFFLTGLAALDQPPATEYIQKKVIQAKSDDPDYAVLILHLLSSNGKLFKGISKPCLSRLKNILSEQIDNVKASVRDTHFSHPIHVFVSLAKVLSDEELIHGLKPELKKLFEKRPYSNSLVNALREHPKVAQLYFQQIKSNAGSSTFDIANS